MRDDTDKPMVDASIPEDGIPVLREIVRPGEETDIPVLDPSEAVNASPENGNTLTPDDLAELADNLQITLNRELDYAIDGAVYERLQSAMEEVAASVKKKVQSQLEQKLPELIEQSLRKEY